MRIGFDFDGTITKNPYLFKIFIEALVKDKVNEIYIISGTAELDRTKLLSELSDYGILDLINNDNIILKQEDGNIDDVSNWKFGIIDKYKIRCYFDNRSETLEVVSSLCTTFLVK